MPEGACQVPVRCDGSVQKHQLRRAGRIRGGGLGTGCESRCGRRRRELCREEKRPVIGIAAETVGKKARSARRSLLWRAETTMVESTDLEVIERRTIERVMREG